MKALSDILFVISNGLLIPVIALLLFLLIKALIVLFAFYGEYRFRRRIADMFRKITQNYSAARVEELRSESELLESGNPVAKCCVNLLAHHSDKDYCEHQLADFQVDVQKELSKNRILIKFGPMLGLMGTLIPMGPALVGLSSGDVASMAYNMQVAFATTVVGMAVAAVGLSTLPAKQRFYARSLNDLEFLFNKLNDK